jgi:hypothetical protein
MLGGGINHMALFDGSQRQARDKLNLMAGIERKPTGILASSPELIQAVAGAAPTMPQRPMGPAPMPMMQPALPQLPMQSALPQLPMQPTMTTAPAPRPMAPAPQPQQPPVMMNEGGFLTRARDAINAIPGKMAEAGMFRNIDKPQPVDVTQDPLAFLKRIDEEMGGAITEKYGSTEAALEEGRKKVNTLEAAKEATTDPKKLTDTVLVLAEVEPTDENKKDFATNVLGLQDVNDIDEINNRIAEVALYSSIGGGTTGTDKLAKALLLGLNNYKQTASARAAAKSGGSSGFEPMPRYGEALPNMVKTIMQSDPGISIEDAMVEARKVLDPLYGRTGGGAPTPPVELTAEQQTLYNQAREAIAAGKDPAAVKAEAIKRGLPAGAL